MTRWQDYEEKLEKVSENDELIINSGGIVKRVKAIRFRGEQGLRGIGISRIESRKTGKNTLVEVFNTENVKIGSFTVSDGENGKNGADGAPGVDGQDGENGVGIVNISTNKEGKITTLRIELSNGKNYEFSIQDGIDGTGAGDMLAENNLSDLANKTEARKNLSVYSKNETNSKIISEIAKTTRFVLAEDGKQLSEQNFSLEEKRKLESLENFSNNLVRRKINPGEDLNNITEPGFYHNPFIVETNQIRNIPPVPDENKAFGMIVYEASGVIQEWTDYNTATKWTRRKYANNWTEWKRFDYIEADTVSWRNKKTLYGNQNYFQIGMRVDADDDYWIERFKNNRFTKTVFTGPSMGLNTGLGGNLSNYNHPSLAIGDSDTGIRRESDGRLGFYANNVLTATLTNEGLFSERPQAHLGASFTRKDYVDGLVANIPKIVWKTENINSRSEYQEFTHNLNIQEWEFFEGRYSIVAFIQNGNRLRIISTLYNDYSINGHNAYWQNNYTDYSNSFGVFHNKIYVRTGNSLLRRILIFKNY